MTIAKKINLFLLSLLLAVAGIFFVSCGEPDYSNVSLTCEESTVTLDVEEEREVAFTIQNYFGGMSGRLNIHNDDPTVVNYEASDPSNGVTTLRLKGLKGGSARIRAVTVDGNKDYTLTVMVRQYADTITNKDKNLYVSPTYELSPNANDFILNGNARDLSYYFYGFLPEGWSVPLTLNDIKDGDEYRNEFVSVKLVEDYLIFKDSQNNLFTLKESASSNQEKTSYEFIPVSIGNEGEYTFDGEAHTVALGEKYTFIAKYANLDNPYVQKDFYILGNIGKAEYKYCYEDKDGSNYDRDYQEESEILLMPNLNEIDKVERKDYRSAKLVVTLPTKSSLIKNDYSFDERYLSVSEVVSEETETTYVFKIDNKSSTSLDTQINLQFYFDGFKNAEDESVNYSLEIPVKIIYQPTDIYVNNKANPDALKFYDKYSGDFGWQYLNLSVSPKDCVFTGMKVSFDEQVAVKYNGEERLAGEFDIYDLSLPLLVRGGDKITTGSGDITLSVSYEIHGLTRTIEKKIPYTIKKGASRIFPVDQYYKNTGVYLPIQNTDRISFQGFYANAEFRYATLAYKGGEGSQDVIMMEGEAALGERYDSGDTEGYKIVMNLRTRGKIGSGVYTLSLDNGTSEDIRFVVSDSFDGRIGIAYENANGAIVETETFTEEEDENEVGGVRIFILNNDESTKAEVKLVANDDAASTVLQYANPSESEETGFSYNYRAVDTTFVITTAGDGHGYIIADLSLSTVSDDFKLHIIEQKFKLDIVSYSLIERLNVYKTRDCNGDYTAKTDASFANIYLGVSNDRLRSATFEIEPRKMGYYFYDQTNSKYQYDEFNKNYVYWTYEDSVITYNPNDPYRDYSIGTFGTFNPNTMTFTASPSVGVLNITLVANVQQLDTLYSYSITINGEPYQEVSRLSLSKNIDELNFSSQNRETSRHKTLIVYDMTENKATNPDIQVSFQPASVSLNGTIQHANIFGEKGVDGQYKGIRKEKQEDGSYLISLDVDDAFVTSDIAKLNNSLTGHLTIAATDWLDENGVIKDGYRPLEIAINYNNGTSENPFTLETAEDVLAIKNSLSSHYVISTSINIASITNDNLPLGDFSGSIVGKTSYAAIIGIKITKGEGNNYGLFTSVSGQIENVQFEGSINVQGAVEKANIGLVTGINNGTLTNIGVKITANSEVTTLGAANIGIVAGENNGTIKEDYTAFEQGGLLSPRILAYSGSFTLSVVANGNVNVGGVVGLNDETATIEKIDYQNLILTGYSNYLSYVNITVSKSEGNISDDYVGGVTGLNEGNIKGSKKKLENGEKVDATVTAGDGILVGGRIEGSSYVGGVVGKSTGAIFKGITSRAFVRGKSEHIGAIAGNVLWKDTPTNYGDHFIQAVDEGYTGKESSMVIRYLTRPEGDNSVNLNVIAFGAGSTLEINETNVKTYIDRTKNGGNGAAEITDIRVDSSSYYGDYIQYASEGVTAEEQAQIKYQWFFTLDKELWTIEANKGFKSFERGAFDTFYAYYFEAAYTNEVASLQAILDQNFNFLSTTSLLYPIKPTKNGVILETENSNNLFIDEYGRMTIKATGETVINVNSVLNKIKNKKIIIKTVNYFNSDESISIVYDSNSKGNRPVDHSPFEIKGNNSVALNVKPNYSLSLNEEDIFNALGQGLFENVSINLVQNTEILPEVSIVGFTSLDGSVSLDTTSLNVVSNGQNVIINRTSASEEGTYVLDIRTKLVSNDGSVCYVNKHITQASVTYTKGAEQMTVRFGSLPVYTYKETENYIRINSQSKENQPLYAIFDSEGNPLQGDEKLGLNYLYRKDDRLFKVEFNPKEGANIGWQDFVVGISIERTSSYYTNRHSLDIYKDYYIRIYADSNPEISCEVPFTLLSMAVTDISIDNYSKITDVETNKDFSNASLKAEAGNSGLLVVSLTPDDADYDYIEIVNTELANILGNGKGSFSLVGRKKANGDSTDKVFVENTVIGAPVPNGLRIYWNDINKFYDGDKSEKYHGVIYIKYMVGTSSVTDNAKAEFKVTVFDKGKPVKTKNITLDVHLENKVVISIDGKTQNADHSYNVARGLKYKLNLEYHGFTFDDIKQPKVYACSSNGSYDKTTISNVAYVTLENGSYYLNIKPDAINYADFTTGYQIVVSTNAYHKEGGNERSASFDMPVNILEYVVGYQYTQGDALKDIVKGMDNGVINVQIGNIQPLEADLYSIIEYDKTIDSVVTKVNTFVNAMTENADWKVYTNLNDAGVPIGGGVTTQKYNSEQTILPTSSFDNYYFRTNGLNITPVITHNYVNSYYIFSYSSKYQLEEKTGVYQPSSEENASSLYTEFRFNVYQSSSSDHPIPIYDESDLQDLTPNSHYILLQDIDLTSEFTPIETLIASFDGNGHTIYFNGGYSFTGENLGLFRRIGTGAVIKNLTLALKGDTTFNTSASSFSAGLLAGENSGNITNCYVHSGINENARNGYVFSASCPEYQNTSCYVAGLVGQNNGNITNSRSSLNITSNFNVAGIAGVNTKKIASSYYKNGKLICNSSRGHKVGGLVVENGTSAADRNDRNAPTIMTSYVSGQPEKDKIYTTDTEHYIESSQPSAGFVFANNGKIIDCYSNISMVKGGSTKAGFVHDNAGSIKNCFSLCVLVNRVDSSSGFARENSIDGTVGTFENCYYLYRPSKDSEGNNQDPINSSVDDKKFAGTQRLQEADFADLDNYFSDFSYAGATTVNSVWFYSTGNTTSDFDNVQFGSGRLELVAPNILANSQKELYNSYEDASGDVIYDYIYSEGSAPLGSLKNPYVIESAESFERDMLTPMTQSGYNNNNYRLIADINYSNMSEPSQTYKITYFGNFEGNGMTISQNRLYSNDTLVNAGLFGQIGKDSSASGQGTIMNLNLEPREISFTSTNCVGVLAGTLSYGNIYNVEVYSEESLSVLGSNFVGGVIGRAINVYNMKNITSALAVIAYYTPEEVTSTEYDTNSYTQSSTNISRYSYAGGIVGFAGGRGNLQKLYVNNITNIMGDRVGLGFGGIDSNVSVEYLHVNLTDALKIKAFTYGGLAVGEVKGNLNKVQISGSNGEYFSLAPEVPNAVGGIAGLLAGGVISNAYSEIALSVPNKNVDGRTYEASSVGGIVGRVAFGQGGSEIRDSVVSGNIDAVTKNLGGIVGSAESGLTINRVAMKATKLTASGRVNEVNVGGLVGNGNNAMIIQDAYALADIEVRTHVSSSEIKANVGGLVGKGMPSVMMRCFTTASITVNLQDKTNVGAVEVVEKSTDKYQYNPAVGGYSHVFYFGNGGATEIAKTHCLSYAAKVASFKAMLSVTYLGTGSGADAGGDMLSPDKVYSMVVGDFAQDSNWGEYWNKDETITPNGVTLKIESTFTWLR